jgi:heme/copper-type cytochrome/quinol oxidase subunit 2
MGNTKKIVGIVVVVVVAILLIAWAVWYAKQPGVASPASSSNSTSTAAGSVFASSTTHTAAPANVVVPDKGSSSTPAGTAVPVVQGAGDPSGDVSYRSFNINIQNGVYTPDTVIVKQGDTVNLELTAVDAAYGFAQPDYGFNAAIPKGKTQTIQFQALQTGSFTFYCESCGGPSKGPVGHIIVAAK